MILTRWVVARELVVEANDLTTDERPSEGALERWFAQARVEYVSRCDHLSETITREAVELEIGALRVHPSGATAPGDRVLVAASVHELRPTSFDMVFRVRTLGEDGSVIAEGRCTISLADAATGEALPLPDVVHRELVDLEASAAGYC
jgi:acyl-CoA thioesterase FadM